MHDPLKELRWDDLRVLLSVIRTGSFTQAAAQLGIEQSTVSRRIAQLEAALGNVLFERSPHGPFATALAQRIKHHAERVEREMRALSETASRTGDPVSGRVAIALTDSFAAQVFVPLLLGPLRARHPALHVDIVVGTNPADLARRDADLAVRFFRPKQPGLVAKRLGVLSTCAIGHRIYAETNRSMQPREWSWITLMLSGAQSPDEHFVQHVLGVEPNVRTTSHLTQIEVVRAGLGVAILVKPLLALFPELVEMPMKAHGPTVDVWLTATRETKALPRVRAVWDFCRQQLPAVLVDAPPAKKAARAS